MKFAQIQGNKVHYIFEADEQPQFASNILIIDITNEDPQPQEGWLYDHDSGDFSEPGTKPIVLTVYQFRKLFTLSERATITTASKTDGTIAAFLDDLKVAPDVELDDSDVTAALDYFVLESLITSARKDEILANTPPE